MFIIFELSAFSSNKREVEGLVPRFAADDTDAEAEANAM